MKFNSRNKRQKSSSGLIVIAIVLVAIATLVFAVFALKPTNLLVDCKVPAIRAAVIPPSTKIQSQIYIDGTPSMNGFVTTSGSRYISTLRTLNTAITEKWQNAQIKFYRFGDNNKNLLPPGDFLKAQTTAFYPKDTASVTDYPFFENSQITDVINSDKITNDNLTFIVTDLTEKSQDMLSIFELLKTKYINSDFAVGILALRSEFNGTVYDVGINNESFIWNTNSLKQKSDPKSYRPFYIIMLGQYANVNYFYERLASSATEILKDSRFVVFDKKLLATPLVLNLKDSQSLDADEFVSSINYSGALIEPNDQEKDKIQLLKLKPTDKPYKYNYKINQQAALPNTIATFARDLKFEIEANYFNSSTKKFEANDEAKDFIKVQEIKFNSQQTEFEVEFSPSKNTNGTYELKANAFLDKLLPLPWLQDWNADEKNAKDGSKTFNVSQLFKGLQELVLTANSDRKASDKLMAKLCFIAEIH
jgi:hypothetical protein